MDSDVGPTEVEQVGAPLSITPVGSVVEATANVGRPRYCSVPFTRTSRVAEVTVKPPST